MNIRGINNLNNNSGNNPNGGEASCVDKVQAFWNAIPLVVKSIISITLIIYITSFFIPVTVIANVPNNTIFKFRIWCLITTVLVTPSIINIAFAFMSWVPDAIKIESQGGSIRYLCNFFVNSFLIQVLYTLVTLFFYLLLKSEALLKAPSSGLWPLIMSEITILCNANPESEVRMFLIPFPIKSKYYPWALMAFFTLINFNIQFDLLCGICYGYLFSLYLSKKILLENSTLEKIENMLGCLKTFRGFVPLSIAQQSQGFTVQRPQMQGQNNGSSTQFGSSGNSSGNNNNEKREKQAPVTTAFKGKGTVLGSTSNSEPKIPGTNTIIDTNKSISVPVETLDIEDKTAPNSNDNNSNNKSSKNKNKGDYQELNNEC